MKSGEGLGHHISMIALAELLPSPDQQTSPMWMNDTEPKEQANPEPSLNGSTA